MLEENSKTQKRKNALPEIDENGNLKTTKFAAKSIDNGILTIAFGNGKSLEIALADIPEEIHADLAMHGLSQKIGDAYAGSAGNYETAFEKAEKVIEQLKNGELQAARGSGESKPRVGELASAVATHFKKTVEEAMKLIDGLSDEDRKTVRNHPAIKAIIQEVRALKAKELASKAAPLVM